VKRILLPPAGTIAFLEFYDAGQARAAFKRLAYRRFKDVPLYLEKAPQGIFTVEPTEKIVGIGAKAAASALLATETDDEPNSTMYVKNIDFSTTQAGLSDAFKHFPGFRMALLKTKPPNAKGERLSMGFGFVTFASKEMATAAMNAGVVLDGRKLEVKFARQEARTEIKAGKGTKIGAGQKKLVVKNLGFNVNKRDLRELFGYPKTLSFGLVGDNDVGRTDTSSLFGCPRNSIIPFVALRLLNLQRRVMRVMRWNH